MAFVSVGFKLGKNTFVKLEINIMTIKRTLAFPVAILTIFLNLGFTNKVDESLNEGSCSGGILVQIGVQTPQDLLRYENKNFIIQCLDTKQKNIETTREYLTSKNLYGDFSAKLYDGEKLPYIDNLINLIICESQHNLSLDEIKRVLVPNGIAYVKTENQWEKHIKIRPDNIDDWKQSLYDSTGNAVSNDDVVGPPKHLQWISGPKWTRHHEAMSSFHAMISANGKVFYIIDEAPQVSYFLPSEWKLIARDAFNGKKLWEKPISKWVSQLRGYKSGPQIASRLLVASDKYLFTVLEMYGELNVIDLNTGEVVKTYPEIKGCEELMVSDDKLYVLTSPTPKSFDKLTIDPVTKESIGNKGYYGAWSGEDKKIFVVDIDKEEVLWSKQEPIVPMTMAANDKGVFYHNGQCVVRLDKNSGKKLWDSDPVTMARVIPTGAAPTLVLYKDVVLINYGAGVGTEILPGGKQKERTGWDNLWKVHRHLMGLSMNDGKKLWSFEMPPHGYESPKDIIIIDDLIWMAAMLRTPHDGIYKGFDYLTGKVKKEFAPKWDKYWFHQRCYRARATKNYLMPSRTGIEMISPKTGYVSIDHWVRGACLYGNIPANGLLYATPHPCGCYMEGLLHGLNALAPAKSEKIIMPEEKRWIKTAEYEKDYPKLEADKDSWKTYRHDNERSGKTVMDMTHKLKVVWTTQIGTKITSSTAANNTLFLSDKNSHSIYALDIKSGDVKWSYVAGGRVNSPPTYYKGTVIFGSVDGFVYALRADTGKLVWKYQVAQNNRSLMANNQIESIWPLFGSVLIREGKVYSVAGRSMYLDHGLSMTVLDANTGMKISENRMNDINPKTNEPIQQEIEELTMPTGNPDILSADENSIYMKSQEFDFDGKRKKIVSSSTFLKEQIGRGAHLFSAAGFLDDTGFHRVHMIYGRSYVGGHSLNHFSPKHAPAGRMLVFDDESVYAFARLPKLHGWRQHKMQFHIYSIKKDEMSKRKDKDPMATFKETDVNFNWSLKDPDIYVNSMVLTKNNLFVAGPPAIGNEETQEAKDKWQGKEGGSLLCISSTDGNLLSEIKIESPPVFDGMIAAYGKIFISLQNGSVVCFE